MNQSPLDIRRAIAADLFVVAALTTDAYAPYTAMLGAPPLPVTEDYAPRIAAGEVWLLLDGQAPIGALVLETRADHVLIFSVAVAPARQGEGHGIRLLDWAERQARAAGLDEMRLYTNARMTRNIRLYTAYGYIETGRRPNPRRPGWVIVDMSKRLGPAAPPGG